MSGLKLFSLGDLDITAGGSSVNIGGMTSVGVSKINSLGTGNDSITINSGTSIFFDINNNDKMIIGANGRIGIGVPEPLSTLHFTGGDNGMTTENVYQSYDQSKTKFSALGTGYHVLGPLINAGSGDTTLDRDLMFYWKSYTQLRYAIISGINYSFTGHHRSYSGNPNIKTDINLDNYVGLIIKSLGKYRIDDTENNIIINNAWPVFDLCNSDNDKSVYGVITNTTDNSIFYDNTESEYSNGLDGKIRINSIGEGSIWICNKNGSLENGDYITSTTVTGYGGKQAELSLHNYTVAKITCDCDFSLTKVVKRRIKLISDPTGEVISFDSQGNIEYEDILDTDGNIQMVYQYQTRFLQADGTLLVDQTDYETRLNNGESVYIACFVGCTYHCG
jgi:hypothetical protein